MTRLLLLLGLLVVGMPLHAQQTTLFLQGNATCDYQQFPFGSFGGTFSAEGTIDTSDFTPEDLQGVGGALLPDSTGAGETLFWTAAVINPDTTIDALGMFLTSPEGFTVGEPEGVSGLLFYIYRADTLVLPEIGDSLDIEEILGTVQAEHKLAGFPTQFSVIQRTETSLELEYGGLLVDADNITFLVTMSNGSVSLNGFTVDVAAPVAQPEGFALLDPWPNPFNPSTTVRYSLARPGTAVLGVYNLRGQLVRRLAGGFHGAGAHELQFRGDGLAGGVYLLRLDVQGQSQARKVTLLK